MTYIIGRVFGKAKRCSAGKVLTAGQGKAGLGWAGQGGLQQVRSSPHVMNQVKNTETSSSTAPAKQIITKMCQLPPHPITIQQEQIALLTTLYGSAYFLSSSTLMKKLLVPE